METFLNKGVNYGVEKDLKIFLQDEEFKKFIEGTPVKSILLPAGRKKYKKIKKAQEETLFQFIEDNPSLCKCFLRYKKEGGIHYELVNKKAMKKWEL